MTSHKSREIRLKSRPTGMPGPANFELAETEAGSPGQGQVLVRNSYMSVDPYMRGRMMDRKSYVPPFQIGEALQGGAVGEVMESNAPNLKPGDFVQSMNGWREWFVADATTVQKVDHTIAPVQAYLGALGMPGLTAYAGLLRVGALKDGDRVFVSAASGAVGGVVCQIAKIKGCTVLGSAGSDEKAAWLREIGCDHAINYKTCGNLDDAVKTAMPDGIDVYFDNVGGGHLQAALGNMRTFGRVAACGMIEQYNATTPPPGPDNLMLVVGQSLTIKGFIVTNYFDMLGDFLRDMAVWTKAGQMKWRETVAEGIERAPGAFIGLFKGENLGKMLVKLD